MQFDDFLGQVQHRARLSSRQEALRATRATLETLAERITLEEVKHLAAQLPQELQALMQHTSAGTAERFGFDTFVQRVSEREKCQPQDATYHARVVTEVLREAVSPQQIEKLKSQLPADLVALVESGSQGKLDLTTED